MPVLEPSAQPFVFYHATRSDEAGDSLAQFLASGALTTGQGEGGQKSGFYVFTDLQRARDLAEEDLCPSTPIPVIVKVETGFNPTEWDFDYELEQARIRGLLSKFRPQLEALEGTLIDGKEGAFAIRFNRVEAESFSMNLSMNSPLGPSDMEMQFFLDDRPRPSRFIQSCDVLERLCNHLAGKDPSFKRAKENALLESAGSPDVALKYVGSGPLRISLERRDEGVWHSIPEPHQPQSFGQGSTVRNNVVLRPA